MKDFLLKSDFANQLKLQSIQGNETMVSFDVSSLFTNIPLIETIDIVADYVYSEDAVSTPPFKKKFFKNMVVLCSRGLFIYKDEWYE